MRDPYEILGVGRHATEADIKAAFRRLAIQHHPDKNPGDPEAQVRFKEINAAHQILSDPEKRAAYDRYGEAAFRPGGAGGVDFGDFGGLDSIFGDLLGAFGLRTSESGNVKKTLELTFEESARGAKKSLSYERIDICGDCRGRGAAPGARVDACSACGGRGRVRYQQAFLPIALERPCSTCRGTGSIPSARCTRCSGAGVARSERTLEIEVPAGIEPGSSRTLAAEGHRLKPQQRSISFANCSAAVSRLSWWSISSGRC